jgi:hypothetical protein
MVFYTYAKSLEGTAGNPYLDWSLLKARTGYDQTHSFTGTINYELPIGKGRRFMIRAGVLDYVLGNWNLVWAYTFATGSPQTPTISGSPYANQQYPGYMPTYGNSLLLARPELRDNWQDLGNDRFTQNNQNQMLTCANDNSWVQGWGNSCMVRMGPFSRGNNGSNYFDRQRVIAASMSISKEVPIKERLKLQLRLDYQNPFKWYNWGGPNTSLAVNSASSARSFGTTSVGGEATTAAYGGLPLMNLTVAFKW